MSVHGHLCALGRGILEPHIFGVSKETLSQAHLAPVRAQFLSEKITYWSSTLNRDGRTSMRPIACSSLWGSTVLNRHGVDNLICNLYNIFVFEAGISHGARLRSFQPGTGALSFFACSLSSPLPTCGTMHSPASMKLQKKTRVKN